MRRELWTAQVVYAGMGTPMLNGALAVVGDHVAAVGSLTELQAAYPNLPLLPKGRALTPPVANPHTHLDLSSVALFDGPYTQFIAHVIASGEHRGLAAAQQGMLELQQHCAAFGDIVARDEVMDWLLEHSPLPGVAYYEVLGLSEAKAQTIFNEAKTKLLRWRQREGLVKVGISPHTPHTLSPKLLKLLCEFAQLEGFPLQIHLAESPAEVQYLQNGEGPLKELLTPFQDPSWQPPGVRPTEYLHKLGVLGPYMTVVHAVQLTPLEAGLLAQAGCRVVSCPRSNQRLQCGGLDWPLLLSQGIEVALGTDSKASSPSLSVVEEAQSLWHQVDPRILVRAATRSAYRVLGLDTPRIVRGSPVSLVQSW